MPISNSCIQANANALIGAATTRQLAQVSGLLTENSTYSVACIAALPSASDNQGRLIYVTDISAYRYSDGNSWSNCYDTTCRVALRQLFGWGWDACGNLGNGICTSYAWSSEVREQCSASNWCLITNNSCISSAIKTDGTLWRWGKGIPNGTGMSASPIQEQNLSTNWCFARQGGGGNGQTQPPSSYQSGGYNASDTFAKTASDKINTYKSSVDDSVSKMNLTKAINSVASGCRYINIPDK